jgi:hypothetical protein
MKSARAIDQVIRQNLKALSKPGALSARPGYQATGGWVTKKPAIVVTVERKHDDLPAEDRLPETLGGYPVDVREASPLEKLRLRNAHLHAAAVVATRPEYLRPEFPFEHDLTGAAPTAATTESLAEAHRPSKPNIPYAPPNGTKLDAVEEEMTILCHASPDAGWPTLEAFLTDTTKQLTIGMYDFTSAHILETFQSVLQDKKLALVLDHPAPNPSSDQSDDQTVDTLQSELSDSMQFAWALERMDPNAAAWIYPNAYHIKVIVRDSNSFWLSSGNLNNSNQPDITPLTDPAGSASTARKSDRDWHVIVDNPQLAGIFEKFLLNDLKVAAKHQISEESVPSGRAGLGELAASEPAAASVPSRAPTTYFAPRTITTEMKLQPLLTPDNYCEFVLPLIKSATKSLYMQTQYIHPSDKEQDTKLAALIQAIVDRIEAGVDVRLINSQYENQAWLEKVQDAGIDLAHVRLQHGVHNKGIVVDSKIVVVSSQNWSGDGVARNRDAGLIIYNEEAARYYEQIFLHDWTKMAVQSAPE